MPYTPLMSEILDKVAKAKSKDKKVELLRQYNTDALRMVLKSSFDPNIEWDLPEGDVLVPFDLFTAISPFEVQLGVVKLHVRSHEIGNDIGDDRPGSELPVD